MGDQHARVSIPKLIKRFQRNNGFGLIALVGVQSNQYPRALDIARPLRAAGIPMALGGFHVSGCLSMLDGKAIDLDLARGMGISIFAGEAEERLKMFSGRHARLNEAALQLHEGSAVDRGHADPPSFHSNS